MLNYESSAFKAWEILVRLAKQRDVITYGELAELVSVHYRSVRFVLGHVQNHCLNYNLPPLTILIVNKSTRKPSTGFIAFSHDNIEQGRAEVQNYDWSKESNPFSFATDGTTSSELIRKLLDSPDTSAEVYARVKTRGKQQTIFREALLLAYDGRCAFSGISYPGTLDSAHIIPWAFCGSDLRMNVRNGILMLCSYHRLFDLGILSVNEDYRIMFKNIKKHELQSADQSFIADLHGRKLALPSDKVLWPNKELIRQRNSK